VLIDFSPVDREEVKIGVFAERFSVEQLRAATIASLDHLVQLIGQAHDADIPFMPHDPLADDPYAAPEEHNIGWTLGHLVAHVTATAEESAAIASILARGIVYGREPRLRYETPWRVITTRANALDRLNDSRKIRLAYLDAFPSVPHLTVYREGSERFMERNGNVNAIGQFLLGLRHEAGHFAQFADVAVQARNARETQEMRVEAGV
jgi:hypothetical protein